MIAYPQYLDVPMMMSVLAALEDGLDTSAALAALGIDLEGRVGSTAEPTAENAVAQRHTVGSLFSRLRARLSDQSLVRTVSGADELTDLPDGAFVELVGSLRRNPIFEFINVMERMFAISQVPAAAATAGATGLDVTVPEETRQVFMALRAEIEGSPVLAATVRTDGGLTAIVSLQKSYVRHPSLDDLRFGRVRVLGKAVGTLAAAESWNVLSRSFMGHMVSGAFTEAMDGLQQINPEGDFPIETLVRGPGVFVVPLAVYV